jgi:hypothetical protein
MITRFNPPNHKKTDLHLLFQDSVETNNSTKMDIHIIYLASFTTRLVFYICSRLLLTDLRRAKERTVFHKNLNFGEIK